MREYCKYYPKGTLCRSLFSYRHTASMYYLNTLTVCLKILHIYRTCSHIISCTHFKGTHNMLELIKNHFFIACDFLLLYHKKLNFSTYTNKHNRCRRHDAYLNITAVLWLLYFRSWHTRISLHTMHLHRASLHIKMCVEWITLQRTHKYWSF